MSSWRLHRSRGSQIGLSKVCPSHHLRTGYRRALLCFGYMINYWGFMWFTLPWRHNGCDGVSNHQPHDCLLNRWFRRRSKKTSKLRVTGLCAGNSPVTGEFPAQRASCAENVSIWWRHHDFPIPPRNTSVKWLYWWKWMLTGTKPQKHGKARAMWIFIWIYLNVVRWIPAWCTTMYPSHKPHNALDKYPTIHHFVTEMCTFPLQNSALWDMGMVHYGIYTIGLLLGSSWGIMRFSVPEHQNANKTLYECVLKFCRADDIIQNGRQNIEAFRELTHCDLMASYGVSWSGLVRVMACLLLGAKPLPEPMLTYSWLDP